ncbi:hypothetical protein QCA50_015159 [Cerrena zonata]|uniref:Cytochrome P450 n=1 Tax=Cerrena zonata TaxID=2478898 RepID=A0AAW0FRB2_9APHY
MMCYPEVQLKAQVELDSVVGTERLPQMDDIGDLPYIQSIIKEVHRFYPTVPLAIPHATTANESIEGYFIPEGSTIFMNIYGIYHDEEMYDKPNVFRPERFLESEYGTKPGADNTGLRPDFHFGSGRRICPGIHLANNTIIMNVMNVLWAFNLSKSNSDSRNPSMPITLDDFVQGISLVPKPFKCDIQPRSDKHAALIHSAFSEARSNFFMYEQELAEEDK